MFRTHQTLLNRLLQLCDVGTVILSFLVAWYIKFDSGWLPYHHHLGFTTYLSAVISAVPVFLILNWVTGMYRPMRMRSLSIQLLGIVRSCSLSILFFMSGLYFLKLSEFSRDVLIAFSIAYILLMLLGRIFIQLVLRLIRARGFNQKFILLVGWSPAVERFIDGLENNTWFGYRIIGYVSDGNDRQSRMGVPCIGKLSDLQEVLRQCVIDHVLVALRTTDTTVLTRVLANCESVGVQSLIIPDYFDLLPARPRFESFGDMPLIDTRYVPLDDGVNAALKRAFDIGFSALVLITLCPILALIALLVKISSPGPVIYKQKRVGLNRRVFTIYKFRTMVNQPHESFRTLEAGWTVQNDPRRTGLGAFLRKTSLDELPQFWNVLIGDMSVIGPRPEQPVFVERFKDEVPKYMIKHRIRPGITGWAQVNGWRGDTSISHRVRYDIDYIENWSVSFDLKILLLTIKSGFTNPNAY